MASWKSEDATIYSVVVPKDWIDFIDVLGLADIFNATNPQKIQSVFIEKVGGTSRACWQSELAENQERKAALINQPKLQQF